MGHEAFISLTAQRPMPFEHDQSFLPLSKENDCACPPSSSESMLILPVQAAGQKDTENYTQRWVNS